LQNLSNFDSEISFNKNHEINREAEIGQNLQIRTPAQAVASEGGQTGLKVPQKKFTDTKRKSTASIKQPREVDARRDIDLLFEDMDMQDLSNVVEKGDINKIIELKKK